MRAWTALALTLLLAGCERGVHDMYDQPRYQPGSESPLFADGNAARLAPSGAVAHAHGHVAQASAGRSGMGVAAGRPALTTAWMQRGRERYDIYCAPCHSLAGDGDGIVVQRGFPAPPSYHSDRLRQAPDAHVFDVITDGYGVMYPYRDRIDVPDRWAIVAYVRALQLSRQAPADRLDEHDKALLDAKAASR